MSAANRRWANMFRDRVQADPENCLPLLAGLLASDEPLTPELRDVLAEWFVPTLATTNVAFKRPERLAATKPYGPDNMDAAEFYQRRRTELGRGSAAAALEETTAKFGLDRTRIYEALAKLKAKKAKVEEVRRDLAPFLNALSVVRR